MKRNEGSDAVGTSICQRDFQAISTEFAVCGNCYVGQFFCCSMPRDVRNLGEVLKGDVFDSSAKDRRKT